MGARLQADIQCGRCQQRRVFHGSNRMDFCMAFSATHMVTFPDDFPVTHNHSTDHRIGGNMADAILCQLNATRNILFVFSDCIHKKTTFAACKK